MTNSDEWAMIALDSEDGKLIYRMMMAPAPGIDCALFSESISVSWQFSDEGLPTSELSDELRAFESYLDALDDPSGNSFITFVFTGRGKREWCYYAKDYDTFMIMLNQALASQPRFPIEIEHSHDPEWQYWSGVKNYIASPES